MGNQFEKKPRILCLHGHGTSAKIFEKELKWWPEFFLEKMDLVFIDAPILTDESDVQGKFDPPYYIWYTNEEDAKSFNEAIAYIEEQMIKLGPFDGVLGVSMGGGIAGTLPGMQRQDDALTKVPEIKFVFLISAPKLGGSGLACPELAKNAFSSPINIPSLHIIGEKDHHRDEMFQLLESFVNPTLLYHHGGHGVPQHLDDYGIKIILGFLNEVSGILVGREKDSSHGDGKYRTCCFYLEPIASLFSLRRRNINSRIKSIKKSSRVQSL